MPLRLNLTADAADLLGYHVLLVSTTDAATLAASLRTPAEPA